MQGVKRPRVAGGRENKGRAGAFAQKAAFAALVAGMVWTAVLLFGTPARSQEDAQPLIGGGYSGTSTCKECHEKQYARFMEFSRKAGSYAAVEKMRLGLSEEEIQECYQCHTTGYGKRTGFVDAKTTPDLKDVGCEACHGPGKLHTETMDMAHIVKTVTIDVCEKCHVNSKVKSFRYKSVIYAGAH
jgi:hypothetical protein